MHDPLVPLTDPARELAELCEAMRFSTNNHGETHLAALFSVDAWSPEFFQIIFTITERCRLVRKLI
jgi:hypothetical protein